MRRYFISSRAVIGVGWIANEIDAETFCEALAILVVESRAKFGPDGYRITSVTELPRIEETGPMALGLERPVFLRPVQGGCAA